MDIEEWGGNKNHASIDVFFIDSVDRKILKCDES